MFFVSKKRYEAAVEKEVSRRMAERDVKISLDAVFGEIHRLQHDMDHRLRALENPTTPDYCKNCIHK